MMAEQVKTPAEGTPGPVDLQQAEQNAHADKVPPSADERKIREFLTNFGGPWTLARTGAWSGNTFANLDVAVAAAAKRNNEGHCIYYLGNPKRAGSARRREADILVAVGAWVDIDDADPEVCRELCDRLDYRPTYVAFTGGGWQAFWRFHEPTPDLVDAKSVNRWLVKQFADLKPDACFSVDHLWRLPGTRNRKRDRGHRLCEVVASDWTATLSLAEAGRAEVPPPPARVEVEFDEDIAIAQEIAWEVLSPGALQILLGGRNYPSRSEREWAFIGACVAGLTEPSIIRACLLIPAPIDRTDLPSHRAYWAKVKGAYVPRPDPDEHVRRQIKAYLAKEAANG